MGVEMNKKTRGYAKMCGLMVVMSALAIALQMSGMFTAKLPPTVRARFAQHKLKAGQAQQMA